MNEKPFRRWRSWRWVGRVFSKMYVLGLARATCSSYDHRGLQHFVYLRGRRSYILGLQREWWTCLLGRGVDRHPHIPRREERYGVWCGRCMPCPDCGATAFDHGCEVAS